jgi:hypothetical protein
MCIRMTWRDDAKAIFPSGRGETASIDLAAALM